MATSHRISRRAARAWKRLGSWYGSRLAEQYGNEPPDDWAEIFDRTDDERLDSALLAVRRASPIHPPTLGQLETAVPKRTQANAPTPAVVLAEAAIKKFPLCAHQLRQPWNYFGPVDPPGVKGVQIPACEPCAQPSQRLLASEVLT